MAQRLSEYLCVPPGELSKRAVLDSIIGVDTHLFLDPHLLRRTTIEEFRDSRKRVERHFADVVRLIQASQRRDDIAWNEARKRLTFPEVRGVSIGYGVTRSDGSAIGPGLAAKALETASQLVAMGIKDPEIFELIGLFDEGFGADRLSDMAIAIIKDDLYTFSARITRELGLSDLVSVRTSTGHVRLPRHPNGSSGLVFVPTAFLRELPIALDWDDIDTVVASNQELRSRVNALIGKVWKRGQRLAKSVVKRVLLGSESAVRQLIQAYRSNPGGAYDLDKDTSGLMTWYEEGREVAAANPLALSLGDESTIDDLEDTVGAIVDQFKRNIEVNGLNDHLYESGIAPRKPRHERYSQLLLYSVADTYCKANNLDISREPNAGSGPVDFKVSVGYERKVLVEVKLSTNTALFHGFEKQLPTYEVSEASQRSFFVIIRVGQSTASIDRVVKHKAQLDREGRSTPTVVVIDGRLQAAASKRR